jgi:enediyne biosynthesis protein E4
MTAWQDWLSNFLHQQSKRLVALGIVLGLLLLAQTPTLSRHEQEAMADRFAFQRLSLLELPMATARDERPVNPHLARHSGWISAVGAAIALNDLDGDALPNDVCQVETRTDQVIVAPVPGSGNRFEPFTLVADLGTHRPGSVAPMGCVPHDMNEDGQMDLLVYYWGRPPLAFLKKSEILPTSSAYVVQEVLPKAAAEQWFTNGATFADMDGDGHSDLIIGNYFADNDDILNASATNAPEMQDSMTRAFNGGTNHILLWTDATAAGSPSVTFADQKGVFADEVSHAWTLAIGAADLDGDLLPEVYFANDFGPDRLLHNRSRPGKVRLALLSGEKPIGMPNSKVLGRDSFKGMGVDFADLNGDGLLDIYVSNIAETYALEESHFVFVSTGHPEQMAQGKAPYLDRSESLGLSRSGWGWETKFGDFDNDGVVEALQATGFRKGQTNRWPELQELAIANDGALRHAGSWFAFHPGDDLSGHEANGFFVRAHNGRYFNLASALGMGDPVVSRAIATADVDGDGDLDVAFANQWETSFFFRNDAPHPGAFLGLRLLNPDGSPLIGAVARVETPDGSHQVRQVDGGNGHSGVRSSDVHFGLGDLVEGTQVPVELWWRDRTGLKHEDSLSLSPGWHNIELDINARLANNPTIVRTS